jgi:hypothetical protein
MAEKQIFSKTVNQLARSLASLRPSPWAKVIENKTF